jgi:ribonuclease P protein component
LTAADYQRVFARSQRSADPFFTVLARPGDSAPARLGLAIAKKQIRRAVDRNRLKRLVREVFRQQRYRLAGLDLVVMARPAAARADNAQLLGSLLEHVGRLAGHTPVARG